MTNTVAVVIPAHNAAATIAETLQSVCRQTHSALEIIVVDDGSTDRTRAIVEAIAADDPRITIIGQSNAGVAAARNTGWKSTTAPFIAFLDADDLWAETKIERQLALAVAGGERIGLVYTWSAHIDGNGAITRWMTPPPHSGDVLNSLLLGNFIGNGSAALVRRSALIAAGGFEPGLRAAGAQGTEDFLFYCQVAARFEFAVVTDHLTGYRQRSDSMSQDRTQMLRSFLISSATLAAGDSGRRVNLDRHFEAYAGYLVASAINCGDLWQALILLRMAAAQQPHLALRLCRETPAAIFRLFLMRVRSGRTNCEQRPPFLPPAVQPRPLVLE